MWGWRYRELKIGSVGAWKVKAVLNKEGRFMMCGEFSKRISDYIDGEIGRDDRALMDRHSAECAACARSLEKMQAMRDRLARLPRVQPSMGFDFALRSRLLMEVAEKRSWRQRAREIFLPSIPRLLASGAAVALLALAVTAVFNERPAGRIAETEQVQQMTVVAPAVPRAPVVADRQGALKRLSQEASYPISTQFYRSQADSAAGRAKVRTAAPRSQSLPGVRQVSVRF